MVLNSMKKVGERIHILMNKIFTGISTPVIFIIFFVIVVIIPIEIISTISVNKSRNHLNRILRVLAINEHTGWIQKSNYNKDFLSKPLKTNECGFRNKSLKELNKRSKKILFMGPSSTFGWGVEEENSYPRLLEKIYNRVYGQDKISAINAGQIGFSSFQGVRLYRSLDPGELSYDQEVRPYISFGPGELTSNIVVFAYGINDLDRFRFYFNDGRPDNESLINIKNNFKIKFLNFSNKSDFVKLFLQASGSAISKISCYTGMNPSKKSLNTLRVSFDDFIKNLNSFYKIAKKNKSKLIIMTTYYFFDDERKVLSENIKRSKILIDKALNIKRSKTLIDKALNSYKENKLFEARDLFLKSIKYNPYAVDSYYYLSYIYRDQKKCRLSEEYFNMARDREPYRIKQDVQRLNRMIRSFAKGNNIVLIDLDKIFIEKIEDYFIDPVHFSKKGNLRIANEIMNKILLNKLIKN